MLGQVAVCLAGGSPNPMNGPKPGFQTMNIGVTVNQYLRYQDHKTQHYYSMPISVTLVLVKQ